LGQSASLQLGNKGSSTPAKDGAGGVVYQTKT